MNITLPLIVWRYLRFKRKDKNISLMMKICFLGILVGTFALTLTLIIMNGFEKTTHEKMQGINAQIVIIPPKGKVDANSLRDFLEKKFPEEIVATSGNSIRQIIVDKDKKQTLAFVKGVEPQYETNVTNITEKIIKHIPLKENPSQSELQRLLVDNQILIGYKTAQNLNLHLGDTISILIPEGGTKSKIHLTKKKAKIAGIFKVGLDEYDTNFAFSSIDFLNSLFDEKGADHIAIKLKEERRPFTIKTLFSLEFYKNIIKRLFTKDSKEENMISQLKSLLPGFRVYSWRELYPAIVSALKLEKYVMFFILVLITLVASMNMISLLFIQIQQKKRDIAIFKAMGMPLNKIRNLFLFIGLTITFLGSTLGLILAGIVGFFLEKYPFIELPDVYYVSHLPARMDPEIFVVVFVCTMLLGLFATWIPARRSKNINVTQVLRFE